MNNKVKEAGTFVRSLQVFMERVDKQVIEMIDSNFEKNVDELKISLGTTTVRLPMNADTYGRLTRFINEEMQETVELVTDWEALRWLADYQRWFTETHGMHKDWFVVFTHGNEYIVNPFVDTNGNECNPEHSYPKSFVSSGWMTSAPNVISYIEDTIKKFVSEVCVDQSEIFDLGEDRNFHWLLGCFVFHACWDVCENNNICPDPHEALSVVTEAGMYYKACEMLVRLHEIGTENPRFYRAIDDIKRFGIKGFGTKYVINMEVHHDW